SQHPPSESQNQADIEDKAKVTTTKVQASRPQMPTSNSAVISTAEPAETGYQTPKSAKDLVDELDAAIRNQQEIDGRGAVATTESHDPFYKPSIPGHEPNKEGAVVLSDAVAQSEDIKVDAS